MNLFLLARMVLRQQAIRSRICHTIDVTHEFQSIECSIFNLFFFFLFEFWLEHVDLEGTEDRQSRVGETESASINATNL